AMLDRSAQAAPTAEARRTRWREAAGLLEEFNRRNPRHVQAPEFALQGAVYLWAEARGWAQRVGLAPTDAEGRAGAIRGLDAAIARLRALEPASDGSDPLAQNIRFRLAQAIADRAQLDPPGSAGRRAAQERALALTERSVSEPSLRGFSLLLRSDLL